MASGQIKFLIEQLNKAGCPWDESKFSCITCSQPALGNFDVSDNTIKLCGDQLRTQGDTNLTMAHELIHAFDDCRAYVDWTNIDHHACSEIRAANLSGDCKMMQEFMRGNLRIKKQHQVCVQRRAVLSVSMNPCCPNKEAAEAAVDKVWKQCYADVAPFDRVP